MNLNSFYINSKIKLDNFKNIYNDLCPNSRNTNRKSEKKSRN